MKAGARIQSTIGLLDNVLKAHIPMDNIAGDFFRPRRYIGSKDRKDIVERLYWVIRHKARLIWWLDKLGAEHTARNFVLLTCKANGEVPEHLFTGEKHQPDILSDTERDMLKSFDGIDHKDMPEPVRLECPDWAYDALKKRFDDQFEDELLAMQDAASLDLRVNTLKCDMEKAANMLVAQNVTLERTAYAPDGLRLIEKAFLSATKAFAKGYVEIQDEGSQLIAHLCGAKPGMRIMDYCAGAGGKTLALAADMENKGSIVAMDIDEKRLERGRRRYRKAGVHNVELRAISDDQHKKWFKRQKETFDVVLVDAPCSSSGTWRRNPDLRWRFYGPSLDEIKVLQADILEKVAKCVRPGGRLVYATCSLLAEENEDQVQAFLKTHPEYQLTPVQDVWQLENPPELEGPYMQLSPAKHGTDGFFTAVMTRK